jgi:hypothetical protein
MNKWKNDWKSPEYNAWIHMIHRCSSKDDKAFKHYGAKGVVVCQRWLQSFDDFYEDMGPRPSADYSLDRIDSTGNYEPSNCRWASRIEQANNKRWNKRVSFFGEMLTAREIADKTGVPLKTIKSRVDRGMSEEMIASKTTHSRRQWEHGTLYGYVGKKCRCDECKQAKSTYIKASAAKQ